MNGSRQFAAGRARFSARRGSTDGAVALAGGSALPSVVKTYSTPVSNDVATIAFSQHIANTDALRTGTYAKTLTFTLSTINP